MRTESARSIRGFTLTELLVVITIIGLLMTFILTAAMDGVRRAEERATQSLISKLEAGLNDRINALLMYRPDPNTAHLALANIYSSTGGILPLAYQRAQVIALYDQLKAEIPDVFLYDPTNTDYPLNFAAITYPLGTPIPLTAAAAPHAGFFLPLGNAIVYDPTNNTYGAGNLANPMGTGIYGASYTAAAGLYKNLGYAPKGYDGVDNNGNGLIDEFAEGNNPSVLNKLKNHQLRTARAEVLYALLVEGQGPLGSVFNRDDFTDREVLDTDNDGLPEFVDAWGQPLQFYRWPIYYSSDLQKGVWGTSDSLRGPDNLPYTTAIETREQNPLDPNQQLVAPAWWSSVPPFLGALVNDSCPIFAGTSVVSGGVSAFQTYFHTLVEPMTMPPYSYTVTATTQPAFWDRGSTYYQRRAYYTHFLISSSGPDRASGIAQLGFNYKALPDVTDGSGAAVALTPANLILIENNALTRDPNVFGSVQVDGNNTSAYLKNAGLDDITNHNIQFAGGVAQ
jgi:prepilin-type N-terminal cleavage/methylation domain-containing protein